MMIRDPQLYFIVMSGTLIPSLLLLPAFIKHRNHHLFVKRGPAPLIYYLCLLFTQISQYFSALMDSICAAGSITLLAGLTLSTCIFLDRTLSLYVLFLTNEQSRDNAKSLFGVRMSKGSLHTRSSLFEPFNINLKDSLIQALLTRYKLFKPPKDFDPQRDSYLHPRMFPKSCWLAILGGICIVLLIIGFYVHQALHLEALFLPLYSNECMFSIRVPYVVALVFLVIISIVRIIVAVRARKFVENLYMLQELRIISAILVAAIPVLIFCAFQSSVILLGENFIRLIVCFAGILCTSLSFGSIGFVLYKIRIEARYQNHSSSDGALGGSNSKSLSEMIPSGIPTASITLDRCDGDSKSRPILSTSHGLKKILQNRDLCVFFESFLSKEFSLENLLLLRVIESYFMLKESFNYLPELLTQKYQWGSKIYSEFCLQNSMMAANISAQRIKALRKSLDMAQHIVAMLGNAQEPRAPSSPEVEHPPIQRTASIPPVSRSDISNVDSTNDDQVKMLVKMIDGALGDIEMDMYDLLWLDSYTRFKYSEEYADYKSQTQMRSHIKSSTV